MAAIPSSISAKIHNLANQGLNSRQIHEVLPAYRVQQIAAVIAWMKIHKEKYNFTDPTQKVGSDKPDIKKEKPTLKPAWTEKAPTLDNNQNYIHIMVPISNNKAVKKLLKVFA